MIGVVPQGLFGAIWMVGTDELKKIMEGWIEIKVPFLVEKKLGDSWGNAKS